MAETSTLCGLRGPSKEVLLLTRMLVGMIVTFIFLIFCLRGVFEKESDENLTLIFPAAVR